MEKRTPFKPVFWISNGIEVLERFTYYGIYVGFSIYMGFLGYTTAQLGIVQSIFLFFSYFITIFSGTLADKFGFKRMLIVSYLAYLPSILLLILTRSYSGIILAMMSIGFAAGIFKPLISGTIRSVTDRSNKTIGFGIYYQMINIGATFGPIIAGKLRAISWDYAFYATAISVGVMFLITLLFYKEPPREVQHETIGQKFQEIATVFSDGKFAIFLILIGLFFWLPLWSFINILSVYIDDYVNTANLYVSVKGVLGTWIADLISHTDKNGVWRVLGESIAPSAIYIIIFQLFVSKISGKFKAIPSFFAGLTICAIGFLFLGLAHVSIPSFIFLGVFLFAIGEMTTSPRITEYITWIAPKEKAGLYVGTTYLSTGLGGVLSGFTYTPLYGWFKDSGHPQYVWYVVAIHCLIGVLALYIFTKRLGDFKELEA